MITRQYVRLDGMALAVMALLVLFAFHLFRGWLGERPQAAIAIAAPTPAAAPSEGAGGATINDPAGMLTVVSPYADYVLTQGLHGQSYGHLAIDLAAGKGEPVLSPINGVVTGSGYDQWGNTFLQIENDIYQVLVLHGVYTAAIGDQVRAGQQVGTESNIGYTLDWAGNSCAGRDCGYHTHLNIYDKRVGANVNPLSLIPGG